MKVGISTASLFSRKNNEEALPLFDALGVGTAEVFLTSFSEYDKAFGKLLNARRGGVEIHSVHVLNTQFEPQLFNSNPRVCGDAFYWLGRNIIPFTVSRVSSALPVRGKTTLSPPGGKRWRRSPLSARPTALRPVSKMWNGRCITVPGCFALSQNISLPFRASWTSSRRAFPHILTKCT